MDEQTAEVRHNAEQSRFELTVDGQMALADYVLRDGTMIFTHTETPPALQGKGVAARLVAGALRFAREHNYKVRGNCSYVAAYLKRHPDAGEVG
jgi:predicted GNAT family acetyltransferase